jgi:acetolactate synthase-1/2/3 large subunit
MHFVAALDGVPQMRGVLCLFEGVCSGAADGYARATGRPAATLLHLGPGLGNGLANFHNARKARSPVVSIVGEHATAHLKVDAPLTSDIQAFARTVSDCVRVAKSADDIAGAAAATIQDACGPPGHVAMLIVPTDYSWSQTESGIPVVQRRVPAMPSNAAIEKAAALIREPGTAILLGGHSVTARGLDAASRTGARVMIARNVARIAWGAGQFHAPQVPYFPEAALPFLADVKNLILVEAEQPVSFFAYPDTPSYMTPEGCVITTLASRAEDGTAALEALVDPANPVARVPWNRVAARDDETPLTLDSLGAALAALLPENALVSEEMVSSAGSILKHLAKAAPHEFMPVTGGSIGQGLPLAVGAAIGAPNRKVVALEADGSGMYTLQALWTMARENLDITIVILANRRYKILDIEMRRTGANGLGHVANDMIDIGRPALDWIKLSEGCGVRATRAATAREFSRQFRDAVKERGPRLIEALLL